MSRQLSCRCGSMMFSNGTVFHCPFQGDNRYLHDPPVDDKRLGIAKPDMADLVMMQRHGKPGLPGPHGSRIRRQPWNQGKRRNGARIQARIRRPNRREQSLADEWSHFLKGHLKKQELYRRHKGEYK